MRKPTLKLGDLVDLKDLKKPQEGVLTVELGGADVNPAGVKQLEASMSDLARNLEGNENVPVSALVGLVMAVKNALEHKLLPEIAEKLLETLRNRFENSENMRMRHPGLEWAKVQAKLEASPDKLWSLNKMEKTKGEPDVTGYDEKTGEFIFMDCSEESPEGRRDCVYDREAEEFLKSEEYLKKYGKPGKWKSNAASLATVMGINLLTKDEYLELQTKGQFDRHSWSWIETPVDTRAAGVALLGHRDRDEVSVVTDLARQHSSYPGGIRSFRASLRI